MTASPRSTLASHVIWARAAGALFDELERPKRSSRSPRRTRTAFAAVEGMPGRASTVASRSRSTTTQRPINCCARRLWAEITARTVELFHRGKRVAAAPCRSSSNRKHTTVREHMPSSHRRYADWTPARLKRRGRRDRRNTSATRRAHPRARRPIPSRASAPASASCGWPRATGPSGSRPPAARALDIGARSYTSVSSILKTNRDRQRPGLATDGPAIVHSNITWPPLLPSEENINVRPHPTIAPASNPQARRHGGCLHRAASAGQGPRSAHAEWLALLLDREAASRSTRRFQTRLRAARLRHSQASIETSTTAWRRLIKPCSSRSPPAAASPPSTGPRPSPDRVELESHGYRARRRRGPAASQHTVHYARVPRLFADLDSSRRKEPRK